MSTHHIYRFFLLVAAATTGFGLWWLSHELVRGFFSDQKHVTGWIEIFLLSVFVLLTLWWFRTHDTREQIAKTDEQIRQSDYFKGLDNLASGEPVKIDIGVRMLIDISATTSDFNKKIRIAFIQRLKYLPTDYQNDPEEENTKKPPLAYAQHILHWLIQQQDPAKDLPDLSGMNCKYQVFDLRKPDIQGKGMRLSQIWGSVGQENRHQPKDRVADFDFANCRKIDFTDVVVENFIFQCAEELDLVDAYCEQESTILNNVIGYKHYEVNHLVRTGNYCQIIRRQA